MPAWVWLLAIGWAIGFSSGRRSIAREYNAAGSAIRKILTGKD